MTIHGSILPFNQQALEKNDVITKIFVRSSNQGDTALCQIIEKQNRIEYLESVGVKKIKLHEIQCSNCKVQGHNHLTCPAPCQKSTFAPYKDHLTADKKTTCDKENLYFHNYCISLTYIRNTFIQYSHHTSHPCTCTCQLIPSERIVIHNEATHK